MNKENDEKLMIFDGFIDTESKTRNLDTSRTGFPNFLVNSVPLLSGTPSRECMITCVICVTCRVTCSTLRVVMDKPSWGPINRETIERILPLIWPLTVLKEFKNSNLEKPWICWPRQHIHENSVFKRPNRSGVMRTCGRMSGTWSEVV